MKVTGRFISFEGGEGAGKSTQVRLLAEALGRSGRDVVATREPGGAPGAEAVRALLVEGDPDRWEPLTETLLHVAARHEHVRRLIVPALARNAWVISDRFADSTMAYQGYGLGVDRAVVSKLNQFAVGTLRPDVTFMLDISVEDGLARASRRVGFETRYERMGRAFHARLRAGFLDIAAHEPDRCAVVPAAGGIDQVHGLIKQALARRLGVQL
ncbi:MAG: dTMP kinase [Alphaproteobacteria bacterium]|nr:dTMP kinase [Alphaproteobacteria bacterium]